ncbi:histidine kinase [Lutibacter sp. HS1-25]|uniref:sensor histidine kinase n=1 Tax=Lutibacter sp. HS1-25 TaxID=2485000 RepID=UPI001013A0F4|nr:sensor histidine kinase [Lutibacter sp. HS1-25]RXP61380.1 histidine kinase [Lutibacter sp. HS1-25]
MKKSLRNINPIVLHILCWAIFILINVSAFYNRFLEFPEPLFYAKTIIDISIFYLNFSVLVPKLLLNNKILGYVFISIVFIFLSVYLINTYIQPVFTINFEFHKVIDNDGFRPKRGPFNPMSIFATMLLFAVGTSIRLVMEWYKNEEVKKEIELQRVHTEISFLKAQLNPHFLFNSLNSIYSLANKKSDDTTEAIVTLAELMRYMIYETDKELVPLQDELNYIKNYISLQNLRLKDSSGVRINIYGKIEHKIEPLLLISFIENAFKYGTDYNGKTDIRIRIEVKDDSLDFEVSNYVSIHKKDHQNSGVGLKNVINRLNLQYPKTHTLTFTEEDKQYKVRLLLKLKV